MMDEMFDSFAYWLADFYLATTVLLVAALVAIGICRQPVKRLVLAKATILAMLVMAGLYALPGWSVISLVSTNEANNAEPIAVAIVAPLDARESQTPLGDVPHEPIKMDPLAAPASLAPLVRTRFSWPAVVVMTYLLGSLVVVAWLIVGAIAAWRLVRRAQPAPMRLSDLLVREGDRHGDRLQLLTSVEIDVAVAIGVTRPAIVLPHRWVDDRSDEELQAVLAHEVAHVQNGDLVWLAVGRSLLVLLWAQPLFWLLRRSLRLDQEALADAAAAQLSDRHQYAEQLVAWARGVSARPRLVLPAAMGLWESPTQLRRRVSLLLDERLTMLRRCPRTWLLGASALALVLAATLSVATLEPSKAARAGQDESDAPSPENRDNKSKAFAKTNAVAADELAGVVEDELGRPLAGVSVDVWTWHPGNETQTDAAGRFRLKGFDEREVIEVQFTKPGYCPRHFAALAAGTRDLRVTLDDRTFLEGRVTGPDGKPVGNVQVRALRGPFENPQVMIDEVSTVTETDSEGSYRLYLEPDTYDLQVRVPAIGLARHEGVELKDREHRRFDIQLKRGPTFRAVVRDSVTEAPVAGFRLWNWRHAGIEGVSNAEGVLQIEHMFPGKFEFNVSAAGEKSKFSEVAGDYARWWSPEAVKEWQRLALTVGGDHFQRNFDDLEFDVHDGMEPVTIVVERCVKIIGQVVDPDGKPVVGATVAPAKTGSGNSLAGDTRYSVRTTADGHFEMRLPASGAAKYNLVAHDGDYEQWRTWANGIGDLLQTKPGDVIEGVQLELSPPCIVRGHVLDTKGNPVSNHEVRAQSADKRESRYYDPTTKTNDEGKFELRFVRPGKHYVQAEPFWLTAEDGPKDAWKLVVVQPDRPTEGVILTLPPETAEEGSKFQLHFVVPPQSKVD